MGTLSRRSRLLSMMAVVTQPCQRPATCSRRLKNSDTRVHRVVERLGVPHEKEKRALAGESVRLGACGSTIFSRFHRFSYKESKIRIPMLLHPLLIERLREKHRESEMKLKIIDALGSSEVDRLAEMPSPRFVKTHLPMSLLPPTLLDTAKVVYVARDPRDDAVSFYHHNRLIKNHGYIGDFKSYWDFFIKDLIIYTPYFEGLKEAWNCRHHPNMLFLFYEELNKDLPATVRKVAKFLNKEYAEEQIAGLCDHLSIDSFKKNKSVNLDDVKELGLFVDGEQSFIRKGKVGGWRDYFDEEMTQQADA